MNTIQQQKAAKEWTAGRKRAIVSPCNTKKKIGMECRINGRNSPCKVSMPGNRQRTGDSIALKYKEKKSAWNAGSMDETPPCKVGMPGNRQRTGDSIAL